MSARSNGDFHEYWFDAYGGGQLRGSPSVPHHRRIGRAHTFVGLGPDEWCPRRLAGHRHLASRCARRVCGVSAATDQTTLFTIACGVRKRLTQSPRMLLCQIGKEPKGSVGRAAD